MMNDETMHHLRGYHKFRAVIVYIARRYEGDRN